MKVFLILLIGLATLHPLEAVTAYLRSGTATLHGPSGDQNLTIDGKLIRYWHDITSYPSWQIQVSEETTVEIIMDYSHGRAAGSHLTLECAKQKLTAVTVKTNSWDDFTTVSFGQLKLKPGTHHIKLRATKAADKAVVDTTGLRLVSDKTSIRVIKPHPLYQPTPGFKEKLRQPHPAMSVTDLSIPGLNIKVSGIDFLSDGTMVVCSWTTDGSIYLIRNYTGAPEKMRIQRFAKGLAEPLGICVVKDRIFVCQKQELTELIDSDRDGVCDTYRCVSNAWDVSGNFHEFTFGPIYHEGKFYLNLAIAVNPGGATTKPQQKDRGTCIAVDPDTGAYEVIAAGLRTPNGITITSQGHILVCDNQGDYLPSNKMVHIRQGHFFNNKYFPPHPWTEKPVSQPVVWQPQNEIGNSPTQPCEIPNGPFKGQILHGDIHHGGLKRVFMEEVNGQLQGAVFRHAQKLRGGINRLAWGPDGKLYAGITGNRGNWGSGAHHGLLRIAYDQPIPFEMAAVRAKSNGLEIEFTQPLAQGQGWDLGYYQIDSWTYRPTIKYGGPKIDLHTLTLESASISSDRTRAFLKIANMKPGYLIHIVLNRDLSNDQGESIFAGECWYNLNEIPTNLAGKTLAPPNHAIALGQIATKNKTDRALLLHKAFCISCHSTDGKKLVGPSFKGLLGKKQTVIRDGKNVQLTVDEEYIRRAILNPSAEYPHGYQPIMPQTLADSFSREDTEKLVEWIKSLK